jgi:hypothetical protein
MVLGEDEAEWEREQEESGEGASDLVVVGLGRMPRIWPLGARGGRRGRDGAGQTRGGRRGRAGKGRTGGKVVVGGLRKTPVRSELTVGGRNCWRWVGAAVGAGEKGKTKIGRPKLKRNLASHQSEDCHGLFLGVNLMGRPNFFGELLFRSYFFKCHLDSNFFVNDLSEVLVFLKCTFRS